MSQCSLGLHSFRSFCEWFSWFGLKEKIFLLSKNDFQLRKFRWFIFLLYLILRLIFIGIPSLLNWIDKMEDNNDEIDDDKPTIPKPVLKINIDEKYNHITCAICNNTVDKKNAKRGGISSIQKKNLSKLMPFYGKYTIMCTVLFTKRLIWIQEDYLDAKIVNRWFQIQI